MRAFLVSLVFAGLSQAAELKVATLHPLLSDLARKVGGERVEVVDLIGKNSDPHHFEPSPEDLKKATDARIFLASGMGLESYLPKLKETLPAGAELVELGAGLPSREGTCTHGHDHDHDHHHGIDPHWWHSIDTFRRAATLTAAAFSKADPGGADEYQKNALGYRLELDKLERWARRELAAVPEENRVLATAHDAFGYFCHDFGFTPLPVQGLNREQMPDANALARLMKELKEHQVRALFPEDSSNPKILTVISQDAGIALGEPLIADGSTAESYEAMVRHNVGAIVKALK